MRPSAECHALQGPNGEVGPIGRYRAGGHEPPQHLQNLEIEHLGTVQPASACESPLDGRGGGRLK